MKNILLRFSAKPLIVCGWPLLAALTAHGAPGPRIIEPKLTPAALVEGDTRTKFTVRAIVTSMLGTIQKVTVNMTPLGMPELELFDDGQHDDGEANDKTYANSFTAAKPVPAGKLVLTLTAQSTNGSVSTFDLPLTVTAVDAKFIVWDGEKANRGKSWLAPQKPINYFKAQTDEKHAGVSALELHGEGAAFIGGGFNWFGWYPQNAGTDTTQYRNLTFWMKVVGDAKPAGVEVQLVSSTSKKSGKTVKVTGYCDDVMDGEWHDVVIPLKDLYGADDEVDPAKVWQLNLNTWSPTDRNFSIYIDDIGFDNRAVRSRLDWVTLPEPREQTALPKDAPVVDVQVDTKAAGTKISPYIYGAAMGNRKAAQEMGITALRAGGNEASTVNWKEGFSNRGSDWYFTNNGGTASPDKNWLLGFHGENKKAGLESYITLPAMGRVAKDNTSAAFDIDKYPGQDSWAGKVQPTDPHPKAGSGQLIVNGPDGKPLLDKKGNPVLKNIEPDPNDDSVEVSASAQAEMLGYMADNMGYGPADKGGVKFVALDNEPDIWHATHRDMHPKGATYDEYLERTKNYATALKKIDPAVKIAGPVFSGWTGYFYSGLDLQLASEGKASWSNPPDYAAHGRVPVLQWWLKQMHDYEKTAGQRLIDILDIHFYPQNGMYMGGKRNDPATMEKRVQETRVLWDPTWKDPSWISNDENGKKVDGRLQIIRMMKKLIAENDPGLELCLGEYCFSGDEDISGGVTQAEILGVFAREGVDQAYYWLFPPVNSSPYFAFKMFRNPDGNHTVFGDTYLPSKVSAPDDISVHVAKDSATGRLTFVVVNKRAAKAAKVNIKLSAPVGSQDVTFYEYSNTDRLAIGQLPSRNVSGDTIPVDMQPLSVLRFDVAP